MEPIEPHQTPTMPPEHATGQRRGRRRGLQLAFAAPAILAALHAGVAAADDHHDHDDDDDDHDDHDHEQGGARPRPSAATTLPLSRASDVSANGFGDFSFSGSGTDPLSSGRVLVGPRNGNTDVAVTVTGAPANTPYTLQFVRATGTRDSLGTFTTNSSGHFSGHVGTLAGGHRVGVFVIQGGSTDQFVSSVNL
jgi:hypothetical protein